MRGAIMASSWSQCPRRAWPNLGQDVMILEMATSTSATAAISTRGLTKRYGATVALDWLDLADPGRRGVRLPRPERRGQDHDDPAACSGCSAERAGRRPCSGRCVARPGPSASAGRVRRRRADAVAGAHRPGECLEFLGRLRGGVDEAYRRMLIERFEFDPRKRVRDYSKGNRQKIQLIAAFAARPDLLVLDEPTSGLDPLMEAAFRDTVAEAKTAGQTVFLSSHILSEVEALCDRVGILREGRLVEEGTLARPAPPVRAGRRGDVRRASARPRPSGWRHVDARRRERAPLRRARPGRPADRPPGRHGADRRWSAASRRSRSSSWPTTTAVASMQGSPG